MSDILKLKEEYLKKLSENISLENINQIKSELFGKNGKITNEFKKILEKFDYIFPQNKETLLYFKKLGINKIKFLGNLKFVSVHNDKFNEVNNNYFKNRIVLCSASTHYNEELIIGKLHKKLKSIYKNLITMLS